MHGTVCKNCDFGHVPVWFEFWFIIFYIKVWIHVLTWSEVFYLLGFWRCWSLLYFSGTGFWRTSQPQLHVVLWEASITHERPHSSVPRHSCGPRDQNQGWFWWNPYHGQLGAIDSGNGKQWVGTGLHLGDPRNSSFWHDDICDEM